MLHDLVDRLDEKQALAGVEPPVLPYRGFPDAVALRGAARRGVALVRAADLRLVLPGRTARG
jgi:hypothetical protein